MNTVLSVTSRLVWEFEASCLNFARGLYYNVSLGHLFWKKEEPFVEPVQETDEPLPMTELARRRAKVRKKEGADQQPTPKRREVKTVRGVLFWMIRNNLCISVLMLGMAQGVIPVLFSLFTRDLMRKNQVLEMVVNRLVMILWMVPIFMICKISNTFWMNDLSSLAYQDTMGKPVQSELTLQISDLVYSTIMQVFFFVQVSATAWIPVKIQHINIAELVLTAIMYSMYAFEYKWMNMGIGVQKRMDLIDRNFAFHLGFGLPLALATLYFENFWIGATLSSIFFPVLALCASDATEPKDTRGRSSYVFYPTEKVVGYFFRFVHNYGLGTTFKATLVLWLMAALFWLGVLAALLSWVVFLIYHLVWGSWLESFVHIWHTVIGHFS